MAVAGHPHDPLTYYFGSTGGGVWKTENAGITWDNLSDPYFQRATVGAIAVSSTDPNIIVVGMGEGTLSPFNTHGDGVYKSMDGGNTWHHLGLEATHNIAHIRIHPTNPDIIYVAARGHRFGLNPERGVYRTVDGGQTWELVLYQSETAGAIDITIDLTNPRFLYTSIWEAQRFPWGHTSGGPNSRIYRSVDGGDTWEDLSQNPGLPMGIMGKIGITASPVRHGRVWALIEAEQGGVYRTDDAGETWTWCSDDRNFLVRPRYFMHIVADPHDADTVYLPVRRLWKSVDGGRTYLQVNAPYVDQHDIWISPNHPKHMILGNDGGASISLNGGENWSSLVNQPTAEIYHIATDTHFPYRIYGAQQDNSTLCLPSRSEKGPISQMDWYDIGGGESGYIAVRDDNPNIVYSSDIPGLGVTRYNHENLQIREIAPWAVAGNRDLANEPYRWNWSTPVVLSPHDSNILYVLGNHVFRTTNEGQSWEVISPDLTRNDKSKMVLSGGPISWEDSSVNNYGTLTSLSESPVEQGVLWVGSDDGWVHLSQDNGQTWENVTPSDMPEWAETQLEASRHLIGTAYLSATTHKLDNFSPYIFKTTDYGQSWQVITAGIDNNHFVRVIREDAIRPGLLYLGTEVGVYVSQNAGESWQRLNNNLPAIAVHDLAVKDSDIVIGTYGRGLWILDNVSPLQQWGETINEQSAHLFEPVPTYRLTRQIIRRDSLLELYYPHAAQNPPSGIVVHYLLNESPEEPISLELVSPDGKVIHQFTSEQPATRPPEPLGALSYQLRGGVRLKRKPVKEIEGNVTWGNTTFQDKPFNPILPIEIGLNRFVIPLQHAGANKLRNTLTYGITAPILVPGHYRIRLTVGQQIYTQLAEVRKDPRVPTTQADFEAQFQLMIQIRDKVSGIHHTVAQIRHIREQLEGQLARVQGTQEKEMYQQGSTLRDELTEIENELIQPGLTRDSGEMDSIHFFIKLDHKLEELGYKVVRSDDRPTDQMHAMFDDLAQQADTLITRFKQVVAEQVPAFNQAIQQRNLPAIQFDDEAMG